LSFVSTLTCFSCFPRLVLICCLVSEGVAINSKSLIADSRFADARQGSCIQKCGNASSPYATCNTPENCGPGVSECGCKCPACPSCVVYKNPIFTKVCTANVRKKGKRGFFCHFCSLGVADSRQLLFDCVL
jgi:hypothetical protein